MNSPFLNFIFLILSLAVAAIGSTLAMGQTTLLTVVLVFFGGYGLGVTFPSFWARLRGVKSTPQNRMASKREDRSQRRTGTRRIPQRSQRGDRPRGEGQAPAKKERGDKRSRSKQRKKAERTLGTIKWFDESKGYGFITPDNGGDDCFVHKSVVSNGGELVEGGKVEFEIMTDDRGRVAATNVVLLK